ncbi:DEAD-domain-containing protein [Crepidotus variabilis]|uniref:ATP-dependent RNA helicase n=1 Tax=Crepidotus variabilis TaxID=179855 RepID=A0A9P6E9L1_9AGAR|nr:DEAD-domain-containing protein [Crepidotus variabilis]
MQTPRVSSTSNTKIKGNKQNSKPQIRSSKLKKLSEKQKLDALEKAVADFEPQIGLKSFNDLPLSEHTKRGLKKAFFVDMTDIQTQSIHVSLKGKDVLGAATTGSGKTLAFLIPVLEVLYRRRWGPADGLGALIVSPTRELAIQIFDVLRSIGGYHSFSAGLVIGGKNLKDERDRLSRMNILVATPGRLLQHMDQTVGFDADNLQVLVLDEADRILDMGFQKTLTALLNHLPKSRQTLLFSATQTDSVSDLARLSLKDPVHIGVSSDPTSSSISSMPKQLEQHYLLVPLDKKLSVLWSFIKTHLQSKIIVFLSSGKQVRFVFETFCRMHPGIPLLHLHGKQKQTARLAVYQRFTGTSHSVLLATDIAARGLDFPAVDWVLQVDAPEDVETYIHRVGRTARYESKGRALLFLMPSEEEGMKAALLKKGIEVAKIKNRQSRTQDIQNQLQNLAFQDPEIKYLGQRAFVSYLRSVNLHKDKSVFKVGELPVDQYAESLGLPGTPKIKFLSKAVTHQRKNVSRMAEAARAEAEISSSSSGTEASEEESEDDGGDNSASHLGLAPKPSAATPKIRTKYDRMFERKNQNVLSEHYNKLIADDSAHSDQEDEFILLKRADHDLDESGRQSGDSPPSMVDANLSKKKLKISKTKRALLENGVNTKLVFDVDGNPHQLYETADPDAWYKDRGGLEGAKVAGQQFAAAEGSKMRIADVRDKEEAKAKKQEKKRKRKEKEQDQFTSTSTVTAYVPAVGDDDGYISPDFDLPPSDDNSTGNDLPPTKRTRFSVPVQHIGEPTADTGDLLHDDEELALKLLASH